MSADIKDSQRWNGDEGEQGLRLDVWYVDHWTIWLDIRILALTIVKVFRREGISVDGHVTVAEFRGSVRQ
ncbi:MAG: sugar transferase [Alicyclobacillus sp.]|nr:sugar transferase [Alicyclobacillus sp.]